MTKISVDNPSPAGISFPRIPAHALIAGESSCFVQPHVNP